MELWTDALSWWKCHWPDLYGCATWTLTKRLEKKLDSNYTRMLREILNKSWRQHPTRYQLYGHLPSITKTIQVRRTRHAGHCWRRRDELISDVLLWTPTYGRAKAGRPAWYIYILPKDPELIYLGFTKWIIKIILTIEGWLEQHFIDKTATRKNQNFV